MSANAIVPRWEWRCFAPSLAALADRAGMPADTPARDSAETYILALGTAVSANIKIRGRALDVKRLRQTDADGLEQWEPVLNASFPLSRSNMQAIFGPRALPRDPYTLAELLSFVARDPALRAVAVKKSRRGFTFSGCIAEMAQVTVDKIVLQSLSLEHEDPKRVLAALGTLGLDSHANTNYPRGLMRALGLKRD